jgi:hypothetical protein
MLWRYCVCVCQLLCGLAAARSALCLPPGLWPWRCPAPPFASLLGPPPPLTARVCTSPGLPLPAAVGAGRPGCEVQLGAAPVHSPQRGADQLDAGCRRRHQPPHPRVSRWGHLPSSHMLAPAAALSLPLSLSQCLYACVCLHGERCRSQPLWRGCQPPVWFVVWCCQGQEGSRSRPPLAALCGKCGPLPVHKEMPPCLNDPALALAVLSPILTLQPCWVTAYQA